MYQANYNPHYQNIIYNTTLKAIEAHPRTIVIRCDLRFSYQIDCLSENDPNVITKFFSSLKAKIEADLKRRNKAWSRNHSCKLNYVWVREYGDQNGRKHYHVLLYLNNDVYQALGNYEAISGCLAAMIKQAWCSATGLTHEDFNNLVHFSKTFYINKNKPHYEYQIKLVTDSADYLAKDATKKYGDGQRSIGSSNSSNL